MNRILVIQVFRLGDLLQTTPLLAGLKERFPSSEIHLLAVEQYRSIFTGNPHVGRFLPLPYVRMHHLANQDETRAVPETLSFLADWLRGFKKTYDLTVNVSYNGLSAALARLIPTQRVIGADLTHDGYIVFRGDWPAYMHTFINEPSPNPFHLADIYCLGAGVKPTRRGLHFHVGPDDDLRARELLAAMGAGPEDSVVAMHPGASHRDKCWPPDKFLQLGRMLLAQGRRVLLTGSVQEREQAEDLARALGPGAMTAAGRTDHGVLGGLLKHCLALVSNDTGSAHIAAALDRPVVTICLGLVQFRATAPYGPRSIVLQADLDCAPCRDSRECPHLRCRDAIRPDDVIAALDHLLGRPFSMPPGSQTRFFQARTSPVDGWLEWQPLDGAPDLESLDAFRRVWLNVLGPGPDFPDSRPSTPPPAAEPFLSADTLINRAVHRTRGMLSALEMGRLPGDYNLRLDELHRLQQRLAALERIDPIFKPIGGYHYYRLASLDQQDPIQLLQSQLRLDLQIRDAVRALARELS